MLQLKQLLLGLLLGMVCIVTAHAATADKLFHQSGDPIAGNPKGKITVVEFFDYQCSHCMNMASVIAAIIKTNPNVRIVFKEFPIRGSLSEYASRAALAANKQGQYYPFNHRLLTSSQSLSQDLVHQIAKRSGIKISKLEKDMQDNSITQQLQNNKELGQTLKLNGTPAFYIGRTDAKNDNELKFVLGEMSQSELQNEINAVANR